MDNATIEHTIFIYESSLPYIGTICSYPWECARCRSMAHWVIGGDRSFLNSGWSRRNRVQTTDQSCLKVSFIHLTCLIIVTHNRKIQIMVDVTVRGICASASAIGSLCAVGDVWCPPSTSNQQYHIFYY